MSDATQEEKVAISSEDVKNIRDYFKHFDITLPDYLEQALVQFDGDQSMINQKFLKMKLCAAILESKHESFQNKMFDQVKDTSKQALYDLQYEFDVNDVLGQDKEKANEANKAKAKAKIKAKK